MFKEFKEFAMRGNVVDLAVGFILGGAFSTIVKSLVDHIIMPPIGLLIGGIDFSSLAITLKEATEEADAVVIGYGVFINNVLSFIIVAFALFLVIRAMNQLKREEEEAPAEPPAPPRSEVLLEEIRDALRASP